MGKDERLKSRKLIAKLFSEGKSFPVSPLRVLYMFSPGEFPIKAGFSASTRNFKKAVDRNRIKRLMREAYRLQKEPLQTLAETTSKHLIVFFIYTGKELPEHRLISEKIREAIQSIIKKINELPAENT